MIFVMLSEERRREEKRVNNENNSYLAFSFGLNVASDSGSQDYVAELFRMNTTTAQKSLLRPNADAEQIFHLQAT